MTTTAFPIKFLYVFQIVQSLKHFKSENTEILDTLYPQNTSEIAAAA